MICDRPNHLLGDDKYHTYPPLPYSLDWSFVPELVSASIIDLGGIQPVTTCMSNAADGPLCDMPSAGEIELFSKQGTRFQMISIVASVLPVGQRGESFAVTPFALSLMPASKRGEVVAIPVEAVAALLRGENFSKSERCYFGYDPFGGLWSLYGPLDFVTRGQRGFLDELGIVIGIYFLATEYAEDNILTMTVGMPNEKSETKYRRRRAELLFRPFQRVGARRIWGVETPIELFLLQELARQGLYPKIQMLIMEDGSIFPSWYHIWRDLEFRHSGPMTEADLYFADERVAVFCDGRHHSRLPQRQKDKVIDSRLAAMGIHAVRVPGRLINSDLAAAGQIVRSAVQKQAT